MENGACLRYNSLYQHGKKITIENSNSSPWLLQFEKVLRSSWRLVCLRWVNSMTLDANRKKYWFFRYVWNLPKIIIFYSLKRSNYGVHAQKKRKCVLQKKSLLFGDSKSCSKSGTNVFFRHGNLGHKTNISALTNRNQTASTSCCAVSLSLPKSIEPQTEHLKINDIFSLMKSIKLDQSREKTQPNGKTKIISRLNSPNNCLKLTVYVCVE